MSLVIRSLAIAFLVLLSPQIGSASIVDLLDFSVEGQGTTHITPSGSSTTQFSGFTSGQMGGNSPYDWTFTFSQDAISSDTTLNQFITTSAGVMRVQDWGGEGTITSSAWVASSDGTMDISGLGDTIGGSNAFGSDGEGITWFYSINGGSQITQFFGDNGSGDASGDFSGSVNHTFSNVAVNSGDSVLIGFTVNVNGSGDGVEVSGMSIDFTAVPEPTSLLLFGSVVSAFGFRRRRRD